MWQRKYVNALFRLNPLATVAPRTALFDEKNCSTCGPARHAARAVRLTASVETLNSLKIHCREKVPHRNCKARKMHQ